MASKSLLPELIRNRRHFPLLSLRNAMDRLLEDWETGMEVEPFTEEMWAGGFVPQVDVTETENEIQVACELPGLEQKDIRLNLTQDNLTISGEKKQEKEEKKKNYYRHERSYGSFRREIPLLAGIDKSKVRAIFKNGVLKITLPKSKEAKEQAKTIPIQAE